MRFPCLLQVSPPSPLCIMWVRGAGIWQGIKESRNLLHKVDFHPSSSKTLLSIMYNLGLGCIEIHGGKSFYLHPTLVWRASVWERNRYPANFSLMRVQIGERKAGEGSGGLGWGFYSRQPHKLFPPHVDSGSPIQIRWWRDCEWSSIWENTQICKIIIGTHLAQPLFFLLIVIRFKLCMRSLCT